MYFHGSLHPCVYECRSIGNYVQLAGSAAEAEEGEGRSTLTHDCDVDIVEMDKTTKVCICVSVYTSFLSWLSVMSRTSHPNHTHTHIHRRSKKRVK
jgi:hypothetical protein